MIASCSSRVFRSEAVSRRGEARPPLSGKASTVASAVRASMTTSRPLPAGNRDDCGGGSGMNDVEERVSSHYGWSGLMEAIELELRQKGIEPEDVTVDQLAPVDNYHAYRLAGTLALAGAAGISPTDRVLDVGGGIGGAARDASLS